ncbi:MAG: hypothetical protein RSH79_03995 [Clostridiales bacterium]
MPILHLFILKLLSYLGCCGCSDVDRVMGLFVVVGILRGCGLLGLLSVIITITQRLLPLYCC